MAEIPREVYEAAARAFCELRYSYAGAYASEAARQHHIDLDAGAFAEEEPLRAAVDVAVAAGRREAAAPRCWSCDHLAEIHRAEGCWFSIAKGPEGANLVCVCVAGAARIAEGETP